MKLNTYFRTYRKRLGLTQVQIAKLLALEHSSVISSLELETRQPKLELMIAYHLLLDIPPDKIIPLAYRKVARQILWQIQHHDCLGDTRCPMQQQKNREFTQQLVNRLEALTHNYGAY